MLEVRMQESVEGLKNTSVMLDTGLSKDMILTIGSTRHSSRIQEQGEFMLDKVMAKN